MRRRCVLGLLSLSLMACGAQPQIEAESALGSQTQDILNGSPAGTTEPSVYGLLLFTSEGQGICTSTLIGARTLLTAAHCVEATEIWVTNNASILNTPQNAFIKAKSWKPHPKWTGDASKGYDIALIELDKPLSGGVLKKWNQSDITSLKGKDVLLVGYGQRENQQDGVKYKVTKSIKSVTASLVGFDQADNKGACFGDSGGPAFYSFAESDERVIGVTSFGEGNCVSSYYTRVDAYAPFITQWMTEKETPTCAKDGMCKATGCTTPDIDCLCPNDGTCNPECPDVTADPDCPAECADDGVCATKSCGGHDDPDCTPIGEDCESKKECNAGLCETDPQHEEFYCSAECDDKTKCATGLECGEDGLCIKKQLPEASRGEKCTKDKTYCTGGGICVSSVCVAVCKADADCSKGFKCSGKDGVQKFCEDPSALKPGATGPTAGTGPAVAAVPGCSSLGDSAWLIVAALSLTLRRRRA